MTQKIYTTARGKPVDFGALRLQNEHVRAVGNMCVNSRGDRIDASGNIIDPRNQQIQRRMQRQTNVSDGPVHSSTRAQQAEQAAATEVDDTLTETATVVAAPVAPAEIPTAPVAAPVAESSSAGLAAAIARSKTVKQELEKTARQQQQDKPVRKF
jgi:hypothetical protein